MTVVVTVTIVNGFLFNKLELFNHSQLQLSMFAHSIDIHFHAHTVIQVTLLSCVFACLTSHMHKFLLTILTVIIIVIHTIIVIVIIILIVKTHSSE